MRPQRLSHGQHGGEHREEVAAHARRGPERPETGGEFGPVARSWLSAPRNLLIVGQVALSLVLLTAGGLFLRGAVAASSSDPGFAFERGLLLETDPGLAGYDEPRGRAA